MSGRSRSTLAAAALLAVGAVALLLAEATALRVASALILLAAIGLGVWAIATPEFLAADRDDEREPTAGGD